MDEIHGREVHDPYRWLENPADPKVQAWVADQDQHARSWLARSPHPASFRAELTRLWDHPAIVAPVHSSIRSPAWKGV